MGKKIILPPFLFMDMLVDENNKFEQIAKVLVNNRFNQFIM
jgi:hypothetical protein